MASRVENNWPGANALERFKVLRDTSAGQAEIKRRLDASMEAYARTVRGEVPCQARLEFQLKPEDKNRRLT